MRDMFAYIVPQRSAIIPFNKSPATATLNAIHMYIHKHRADWQCAAE